MVLLSLIQITYLFPVAIDMVLLQCKIYRQFSYKLEYNSGQCRSKIRLHILCSLIFDLHCPEKLLVASVIINKERDGGGGCVKESI